MTKITSPLDLAEEEQPFHNAAANVKTKRASILACLIVAIIVCALVVNNLIVKQNDVEYRDEVEELLKHAVETFENIRGIPLENVEVEVITIDWAKENWGKTYAEIDKENLLREERIYKALFMIPESESLYEARVEWWGMIVSAVWQDKIYVVKEYFNPLDKFNAEKTLIHELTHIMQKKFSLPYTATFDGEKAKAALIEGDARLMEEAYVNKTAQENLIVGAAYVCGAYDGTFLPSEISASLPDSISRLNYFPYEYGLKFVRGLYMESGWETVNQAYDNPPTTTEQIMHLPKYFADEKSLRVEMPKLPEEGWQKMKSECFGEYFILVMLENWLPTSGAAIAADGWGGDNFTYYERGNDYFFVWNITWDSIGDALDFYTSFKVMMDAAGAEEEVENLWVKYGRYLSLTCEDTSTLLVCSMDKDLVRKIVGCSADSLYKR